MTINMELENCIHELRVQIQELKGKMEPMQTSPNKTSQTLHMDNQLKKFEELLLYNVVFKVQNQALANKNPKWKDWWQTMQKITKEQIQDNLEIVCANEDAYLYELVTYKMQFLEYKYDWLSSKLIEIEGGVGISQILIFVEPVPTPVNIHSELVVTITEVLVQMQGGSILLLYLVLCLCCQ